MTAGMMPAAPLVGAVTTPPPAAFSSFTPIAHRTAEERREGKNVSVRVDSCGVRHINKKFLHYTQMNTSVHAPQKVKQVVYVINFNSEPTYLYILFLLE